jgi:hypothetical protein
MITRLSSHDAFNCPLSGLADERLRIGEGLAQSRQRGWIAPVAQDDGGIAEQAAALGAHESGPAKTLPELSLRKAE